MANISQIEVNGTIYNIIDAVTRNYISVLNDWYLWDNKAHNITYSSPDHSRIVMAEGWTLITGGVTDTPNYSLSLWADTGNLRVDKYDYSTGTITTLGYVPLTKNVTKEIVKTVNNTSLITPESGWTITVCLVQRWGQFAYMYGAAKRSSTISIPASGNITNIKIGTLDSGYRPVNTIYLRSNADSAAGAAWLSLGTDGGITLNAMEGTNSARTLAANTPIHFGGGYLMPMTNNF